jgi:hypothetical protein
MIESLDVKNFSLEDGDWDTATDSMSSVNQGICLDAGDMLG